MKNRPLPWQCIALLPALVALIGFLGPLAHAGGEQCHSACQAYQSGVAGQPGNAGPGAQMSMQYAIQQCGALPNDLPSGTPTSTNPNASPIPLSAQGISPHYASGDPQWSTCFEALQSQWGVLGQHCSAISLDNAAHNFDEASVILYSAASAVCLTACAAQATAVGSIAKAGCIGLGAASTAEDLIADVAVSKEGDALSWGAFGVGVGGSAAAVGSVFSSAGTNANTALSCGAGIAYLASAILKGINLKTMDRAADTECSAILALQGPGTSVSPSASPTPYMEGDFIPSASVVSSDAAGSGGGSGSAGGIGLSTPFMKNFLQNPLSPQYAEASAGPAGALLQSIPPDAFNQALGQLGTSAADIANRLAHQSPASVMSSLPGMTPELSQALNGVQKDVMDGKVTVKGLDTGNGVFQTLAGGPRKPASAMRMHPFAAGAGNAGAHAGELAFGAHSPGTRSTLDPQDIWHSTFHGTIFQIISLKLDQSRNRIDQLEWESPMNRALAGLPSHKKEKGGSQK